MNRGDYILTQEGQKNLLLHRRLKRLYCQIKQEPKAKKGIDEEEEKLFQQQIIQTLQDFKKRAYRSPVILEVTFCCNQHNPPAIHTLAKNYLDLLSSPVSGSNIKRKRLLYKDDGLIKILIVNYNLDSESEIFIKADRLKNFFEDVKLAERIIHNDFEGDRYSYNSFDVNEIEQENNKSFPDPFEKLENLREDKESYIKLIGFKAYNVMEDFALQNIQKDYLRIGNLRIFGLIALLTPSLKERPQFNISQTIEEIMKEHRNFIISPPFTLDLKHAPIKDGQTKIFKSNVGTTLKKFKLQFHFLFPFRVPLGVIVLYVPPKIQNIDLDNLARYIIPFVNDILQPKMGFVKSENSITRYQFVELPRYASDSDTGYVRLIFDDPFSNNIWDKIDNVIDKWSDVV